MYVFFKQKTADEMRISDWSSDVCSSDLWFIQCLRLLLRRQVGRAVQQKVTFGRCLFSARFWHSVSNRPTSDPHCCLYVRSLDGRVLAGHRTTNARARSEEHTSELQSLMRISYAVFCLKKKIRQTMHTNKTELHTRTRKI